MSDLSRISQTLLDYARSGAKRNWSRVVGLEHLLVAIRRWDTEWFDNEYPTIAEKLEMFLSNSKGEALKPEDVDPAVTKYLEGVSDQSDVQKLAKSVVDLLSESLDNQEQPKADEDSAPAVQTRRERRESDDEPESSAKTKAAKPVDVGLQANVLIASRVAKSTNRSIEEVKEVVANNVQTIAFRVLGKHDDKVDAALDKSLGTQGRLNAACNYLDLVGEVLNDPSPEASRVATQLALAYVDAAEFAASLDEVVTEEEIETINAIRLEVRGALGDRIDAKSDAVAEFEAQFAELVGMATVKDDLRKRVEYMLVSKRKASRGQATSAHRMHMAFVGNPGTGKTTVARLFGQMLKKLGLLSSDVFIETDRAGLVGEYIGHTEKKTRDVIRKADGGVLFVDEAYALNDRYSENRKGFGEVAVDVIVKEMEDRRQSLAVIFAGYTDRMTDFLLINPGLKSRIPSVIEFPDYSNDELLEITTRIAARRGLVIDPSAEQVFRAALSASRNNENFGNAREVENLMDVAQRNLIERLAHLSNLATHEESSRIIAEDVPAPTSETKKQPVGFGRYI